MIHRIGFKYAWEGICYAFATQPNFKVHSLIALFVLVLGLITNLSLLEWVVIIFTISLVFMAEMINTSLESMTDLIEEKHHANAKIAKDVSAGMVLLTTTAAIVIGGAIFLPKLFALLMGN